MLCPKQKINACAIISELRVAHFSVCIFHIVVMLVVRHALKIDILKLQSEFFNGYQDGDRVSYLFVTNKMSLFQDVTLDLLSSWFVH